MNKGRETGCFCTSYTQLLLYMLSRYGWCERIDSDLWPCYSTLELTQFTFLKYSGIQKYSGPFCSRFGVGSQGVRKELQSCFGNTNDVNVVERQGEMEIEGDLNYFLLPIIFTPFFDDSCSV